MKVYIVVGNKRIYGVYTDKEKAMEVEKNVNRNDAMGGGYGLEATVEEAEVK